MSEHSRLGDTDVTVKITPPSLHIDAHKARSADSGKAVLAGLLGGVASAVGYMIYQRLPDEQRDRLHSQARTMLSNKINEMRANFNL